MNQSSWTHITKTLLPILLQAWLPCYFLGCLSESLSSQQESQRQAWLVGIQQRANAIAAGICFDSALCIGKDLAKGHRWQVWHLCCQQTFVVSATSCSGLNIPKDRYPLAMQNKRQSIALPLTFAPLPGRCVLMKPVIHVSGVTISSSDTLLVTMPTEQEAEFYARKRRYS